MLYKPITAPTPEFIVTCHCGCGSGLLIRAERDDFNDSPNNALYSVSLVESSWYAKQTSRFKPYFKRLWKALRGKEYLLTEFVLNADEFQELTASLSALTPSDT
jgi:hypothetical protein